MVLCLCVILMAARSEANLSSEKADKRQELDWPLCLCLHLRFAGSVMFEFHSLEADVLGLSVAVIYQITALKLCTKNQHTVGGLQLADC